MFFLYGGFTEISLCVLWFPLCFCFEASLELVDKQYSIWFLLDLSLTYLIIVMGDACQFSSFPNASVRQKVYSFLIFAFIKEFLTLISVYFTPFFLPWFHCTQAHFNECLRNAESLCHSPGSLDWGIEVEREISRYRLQGRAPYLLPKYSELTRRYYFTVVKVKMFVNSFKISKFKSRLCKAPLLTLVFLKSLKFSVNDCLGIFLFCFVWESFCL